MTEERKKIIDRFQRWLDTEPNKQITAFQCANIAEEYHKELLSNRYKMTKDMRCPYCKSEDIIWHGKNDNCNCNTCGKQGSIILS